MHSNKTGNKLHKPILRHGQIVFGIGVENDSSIDFENFCFFNVPWYVFYHLHVISDWFLNIFPKKKK